jgi:hypothetical protein
MTRLSRDTGKILWLSSKLRLDWLLPERDQRGLHLPATWLFSGAPTIDTDGEQIHITFGDKAVARFHYWNDELRERHYIGAGSRVGGELLICRNLLEPHISAGATLCWVVTLSITQRGEHKERFGNPEVVGTWLVGGSRLVWPDPWRPPSPRN